MVTRGRETQDMGNTGGLTAMKPIFIIYYKGFLEAL